MPLVPMQLDDSSEKRFSANQSGPAPIPSRPSIPQESRSLGVSVKPKGPVEPQDIDSVYRSWQADPSRENLGRVVSTATPYISKAVQRHLQTTDPVSIGHAKAVFIKSLPRYDANMASLPTFIDRQLQPMIRWQATRDASLKLPDRMRTDIAQLARAEKDYVDEYGRAPSTRQLSDYSGLSTRRIANIRHSKQQVHAGSSAVGEVEGETPDQFSDMPVYNDQAASHAWLNIVRDGLGEIDQYILEHTVGLDGAEIFSNRDISHNLKLTPGAISQRKAKIQAILDRQSELNPFK